MIWFCRYELTPRRAGTLFDAIADALDGRCLTRAELADAVGDKRLLSAWGELLGPLAIQGRLCFGPPQGANVAPSLRIHRPLASGQPAGAVVRQLFANYCSSANPMHPKSVGLGAARPGPAGDQGWTMYHLGN